MASREALIEMVQDVLGTWCSEEGRDAALLDALTPMIRKEALFWPSVMTGQFWLPVEEFHARAEEVLGREVPPHDLSKESLWAELQEHKPDWMPHRPMA